MMKIAIISDNDPESYRKWEIACKKKGLEYKVIDYMRDDWLEQLKEFKPDFCVCRPPGDIMIKKKVFDEKMYFLKQSTSFQIYPEFHETIIYENKASLAYFLKVNNMPHPNTFVSYSLKEALNFVQQTKYPIVSKTLIGAAGSGIKILKSLEEANNYVNDAFKKGIRRRFGPNKKVGSPNKWFIKAIQSPDYFIKKLKIYKERHQDVQKGVVLFQEYIQHDFEWRIVKIGESYFGYKKLKIGDKASGSKQFEYGPPPQELLDFTKSLCDRFKFNFMAVDLFKNEDGIFVNELQTIFGHKNPYICKVNDRPGRYIIQNNEWIFEPGEFNANESYDLRLDSAIELYKK